MAMKKMLRTVLDRVNRGCTWFCILNLGVMTFLTILQVVLRYVFTSPLTWVEEFTRYQMVWLALVGAAIVTRKGAHLKIVYFLDKLPPPARKWVSMCFVILSCGFLTVVLVYGLRMVGDGKGVQAASIGCSMVVPYFAVPLGAFLMLLQSVGVLVGDAGDIQEPDTNGEL